jgi:CheY-like chemotaxis protein
LLRNREQRSMAKKILLADDSITIQKVVELTFSDGDYEVSAVNNGAKAIQKLSEMRPDIILSDIIMPEKNGYEVCEFVKSHPDYRTIPVILLTGTFEPFDPDRADKAGCDAVVTKPFESQSLIHKVEELIDAARSNAPTVPSKAMTEATPPPPPAPPAPTPPPSAPKPAEQFSGETRALPKMNFDDLAKEPEPPKAPAPPAPSAPSPWEEQPAAFSGETRAFPRMNFEEMQRTSQPPEPPAPPADADSPFGASPPAESFSGETRAFPKLSFDDLQKSAPPSAPEPPKAPPESAPSPWGDQPSSFPRATFDEIEGPPSQKVAPPPPPPAPLSPWDESPAPSAPAWAPPMEKPAAEELPFSAPKSEEPVWTPPPAAPAPSATSQPSSGNGMDLTDEQIDRIARRVVQLMSDQVVRNIAWEVIPDLAEMVVKERIRELETE